MLVSGMPPYSVVLPWHCGTDMRKAVRRWRTADVNLALVQAASALVPLGFYCCIETTMMPLGFAFAITGTALSPLPLSMT